MDRLNYFDEMLRTVEGYNKKFPAGSGPFQIVTRLCEEAGELASEVNHFEDMGMKREKHGLPDKSSLAKEAMDVMRAALSIVVYYDAEQELREVIHSSYQTKVGEGYIIEMSREKE
jgi:NTP pyrophosphatase (non-canonical NTP hydrolase)